MQYSRYCYVSVIAYQWRSFPCASCVVFHIPYVATLCAKAHFLSVLELRGTVSVCMPSDPDVVTITSTQRFAKCTSWNQRRQFVIDDTSPADYTRMPLVMSFPINPAIFNPSKVLTVFTAWRFPKSVEEWMSGLETWITRREVITVIIRKFHFRFENNETKFIFNSKQNEKKKLFWK